MTKAELMKIYHKNQRDIGRLYNTMTPLKVILELSRDNDIALQNESAKL